MCIKWGQVNSEYFNVSNCVRQGGVLSSKLFAIYIDDLSNELALCKSGCYIKEQCMNHILYADDICLLAPSAIGLQQMLDVCFNISICSNITFKPVKSVCVAFIFCHLFFAILFLPFYCIYYLFMLYLVSFSLFFYILYLAYHMYISLLNSFRY